MSERFFGGQPAAVITRLIVISIVVGVILTAIGISPFEIVDSVERLALRIYNMGFGAVEWLFRYFWLGAIIVFPVWLVSRLWSMFAREDARASTRRSAPPPGGDT
jgi:hypothetical protein